MQERGTGRSYVCSVSQENVGIDADALRGRRPYTSVRVRIVRQPKGTVSGIALEQYRVGEVYEVTATLGTYLVAEGWAVVEMRKRPRAPDGEGEDD